MKMNKVKSLCMGRKHCMLVSTDPAETMIYQWIGNGAVLFPVRGTALDYATLQVVWDVDPVKWEGMVNEDKGISDELQELLEFAPSQIDETAVPDNILGSMNGYMIVQGAEGERAVVIDEALLSPVIGDGRLHLVPIKGQNKCFIYANDKLAGIVAGMDREKAEELQTIASRMAMWLPLRDKLPEVPEEGE